MEVDLTDEQRLLRDTCRDFADRELKPNARRWDREHRHPAEAVRKAFELGLPGVAMPEEWGGAGLDTVATRSRWRRSRAAMPRSASS